MTGRQYPRTSVSEEVYGPTDKGGLPVEEITVAEQLKKANYTTGMIGKWHLGQRLVYLPGNQGFDFYLGIPYSDDMGNAKFTSCPSDLASKPGYTYQEVPAKRLYWNHDDDDHSGKYLPLVYQEHNRTKIVEQPLDFSTLAYKYNDFATKFIEDYKDEPFFLYFPFSHVHASSGQNEAEQRMPNFQYSSCQFRNTSRRGAFGDALSEVDWMIGNVQKKLQELGLEENTLILFTSDNGPWNGRKTDGGNYGIFGGISAGYPWTGKASTWEGGIREPAFAYWKGQIDSFSRSSETISSMDVFPTFSRLAGVSLPDNVTLDGRDMTEILLREHGKSKHDFLFIYGNCVKHQPVLGIKAVRHGPYKAHFCTAPGLGGDSKQTKVYDKYPLLFNVETDASEAWPLNDENKMPQNAEDRAAVNRIMKAYAMELATFKYGTAEPLPPGPGEGPHRYGLCCNRATNCSCESLWDEEFLSSIFNVGSKAHHDLYHDILGEVNHMENVFK